MSIAVMTEVWRRSRHSGSHLLMMLALADFSDDKGCSYPAVSTLATKCRMKARNANVVLAALRESKELEVKPNAGPHGVNRYRIVLSALGAPLQLGAGVQGNAGVQADTGVQSVAGAATGDTLQGIAGTPARACPIPLQPVADKPSLNRQEPSKRERASKKAKIAMPEGFDAKASERVNAWATGKGFADLDRHLEHFVGKARASGYVYADWDQAFMNAVREDWAKLRANPQAMRRSAQAQAFGGVDYAEGA